MSCWNCEQKSMQKTVVPKSVPLYESKTQAGKWTVTLLGMALPGLLLPCPEF